MSQQFWFALQQIKVSCMIVASAAFLIASELRSTILRADSIVDALQGENNESDTQQPTVGI